MGKKIFVSYKYSDSQVRSLPEKIFTTARHYVDVLQDLIEAEDHINKGEDDGEDLSSLGDSAIGSKLGDKIYDSTVTIVLVSKGMKENIPEKDQWIPWEISYSLREQMRDGRVSKTNAVLAVVLPDKDGVYDYFIQENTCPHCNCRILKTDFLFEILRENMFNMKTPVFSNCHNHIENKPHVGYSSYIHSVKWCDFIDDMNKYLDIAARIKTDIENYEITKAIS